MTEELDLIRGSGNVYRDLGWPDAEARQMRAELAAEILRELRERRLSQRKAAEIVATEGRRNHRTGAAGYFPDQKCGPQGIQH